MQVKKQQLEADMEQGGKNIQKIYTKKIFMTHIITMMWSLT